MSSAGGGGSPTTVKKNDVAVAARQGINLIEGANITLTVADDSANGEVDVTIAAAGGSLSIKEEGGSAMPVTSIDFVGSMTTASAVGAVGTLTTAHGSQAGGTTHDVAVAGGAAGFMSGTDKTKLDGIASGATAGVTTQDEGVQQGTGQTTINFVGAGVSAAAVGATTTVTIPGGGSAFSPATTAMLFDDFSGTPSPMDLSGWSNYGTTVGVANAQLTASHVGGAYSYTDPANGAFSLTRYNNSVIFGATSGGLIFDVVVYILNVGDASNDFTIIVGLGDVASAAAQNDGVFFRYNYNVNSGRWVGVSELATVETVANGGADHAMTANEWWRLRAEINAAGDSITFYTSKNGGALNTLGTVNSVPTGAAAGPFIGQFRVTQNAARYLVWDYFYLSATVTR